jgi:hypothetical protein
MVTFQPRGAYFARMALISTGWNRRPPKLPRMYSSGLAFCAGPDDQPLTPWLAII